MFEVRPLLPALFCFVGVSHVAQKYVAPILMGYLSGFIQNLPDLKLSMWQGNVVLKNLQIKWASSSFVRAVLISLSFRGKCVSRFCLVSLRFRSS
jgi:hypothetical protein